MTAQTDLAKKMLARADADGLADDHPLRVKAVAFDEASVAFYSGQQTVDVRTFTAHWCRARRAWSDYSGEPLL